MLQALLLDGTLDAVSGGVCGVGEMRALSSVCQKFGCVADTGHPHQAVKS
jgi:hypothetical protein